MQIIAIAGPARAGKDTVGTWFQRHRNGFVTHFAGPIKSGINTMFSLDPDVWNDARKEQPIPGIDKSPRVLAQTLGTEWGRTFVGGDCWVWALEQRLRASRIWHLDNVYIAIPDARFENEAKWVRDNGGTMIHVTRNGADGRVGVANHASEAGIAPASGDIAIDNNGTLVELYERLDHLFPFGAHG